MVFFTCNACGSSLKKNQVEKHYQCECPRCDVISCMDCGQDFYGDDYTTHTKCISEAEKYQGGLFKESDKTGGVGKGEQKQQEWLKRVQEVVTVGTNANPRIGRLLERVAQYPNIPRKKSKFENFVKNSINVHDQPTLEQLWDLFSSAVKPKSQNNDKVDSTEAVTNETDLPDPLSEPEEKKKIVKHIKKQTECEDKSLDSTNIASTADDDFESVSTSKTKKKKKHEKRDKVEEEASAVDDGVAIETEALGVVWQEGNGVESQRLKKKKKKRKLDSETLRQVEESIPNGDDIKQVSIGKNDLNDDECVELATPPKKKKKKKKLKHGPLEMIDSDTQTDRQDSDHQSSVGPVEVALEYINHHHQSLDKGEDGASNTPDIIQVKRTKKKAAKKFHKSQEDTGLESEMEDKRATKKHKKHKQ